MSIAYLNGQFIHLDQARISPMDRGFLLGDGVYEAIPVYNGRLFRLAEHIRRLENSLAAAGIANPFSSQKWNVMLGELVSRNGGGEQSVYFQVTRGVAPRTHHFPEGIPPSVFAMTHKYSERPPISPAAAITREDYRWSRCDIKSISLMANAMLREEAVARGATETIMTRAGWVTEGAASNVFLVKDDIIMTPPTGSELLSGVTRGLVVELLEKAGRPVCEAPLPVSMLFLADEVWITSSSLEITPVITLDGKAVGNGEPGPLWKTAFGLFEAYCKTFAAAGESE